MSPDVVFLVQKCFKIRFQSGLRPRPHWGALTALLDPIRLVKMEEVGEVSQAHDVSGTCRC